MAERFVRELIGASKERHPNFATHHFYKIDVVDQESGRKWRVEGFSAEDGKAAAEDARLKAFAKITELEQELATAKERNLP